MSSEELQKYLSKRYADHKSRVRIAPCAVNGAVAGFGIVSPSETADKESGPLHNCEFIMLFDDARMRAWRVSDVDLSRYRPTMSSLAQALVSKGSAVPVREAVQRYGLYDGKPDISIELAQSYVASLAKSTQENVSPENFATLEERRLNKAGLTTIQETFDPVAMKTLEGVVSPTWTDYSFYASKAYGDIRRQAADVFPVLAQVFPHRPGLRGAIDSKEPLKPVLQQAFGLGKGAQKRLQGQNFSIDVDNPEYLIRHIGEIAPDWIPQTEDQWMAFCDVATTAGRYLPQITGGSVEDLYAGSKGDWVKMRRSIGRAITDSRPPENLDDENYERLKTARDWRMLEKVSKDDAPSVIDKMMEGLDIPEEVGRDTFKNWLLRVYAPQEGRSQIEIAVMETEFVSYGFVHQVALPALAYVYYQEYGEVPVFNDGQKAELHDLARTLLFKDKAAPAILEMSHRYLIDTHRLEAMRVARSAKKDSEWPALFSATQAPNGLHVVPLTSTAELIDESGWRYRTHQNSPDHNGVLGLDHCVGGYASGCKRGAYHIVSVRQVPGDDGLPYKRLSTIQIEASNQHEPQTFVLSTKRVGARLTHDL